MDQLWERHAILLRQDAPDDQLAQIEEDIVIAGKNTPPHHVSIDTLCELYKQGMLAYPRQFHLLKISDHPLRDETGMTFMDWALITCPTHPTKVRALVDQLRVIGEATLTVEGASQVIDMLLTESPDFIQQHASYFKNVVIPFYVEQGMIVPSMVELLLEYMQRKNDESDNDSDSDSGPFNFEDDPDVMAFGDALVL